MNLSELEGKIEEAVLSSITEQLSKFPAFRDPNWREWLGVKTIAKASSAGVLNLLVTQNYLRNDAPSLNDAHDAAEARRTQELVAERISPTREDRAYQVLCALLSSDMYAAPEKFVDFAHQLVEAMEERGGQ